MPNLCKKMTHNLRDKVCSHMFIMTDINGVLAIQKGTIADSTTKEDYMKV